MTQVDLAAKAGVSEMTINRIETGRAQPRLHTIRKLADALEIDAAELIGNEARDEWPTRRPHIRRAG